MLDVASLGTFVVAMIVCTCSMFILTGILFLVVYAKPQASWKRFAFILSFSIAIWSLVVSIETWKVYQEVSSAIPYGVGPGMSQDAANIQVQGLFVIMATVLLSILGILNIRRFRRI